MTFLVVYLLLTVLTLYVCSHYTKKRLHTKGFRISLFVFYGLGNVILFLVFVVYRFLPGTVVPERISAAVSVYFVLLCCMGLLYAVYDVARAVCRKKGWVFLRPRGQQVGIFLIALVLAVTGTLNSHRLMTTRYSIAIDKPALVQSLRLAVLTDAHLGAGMTPAELETAVDKINEEKPDVVLIVGDVLDETTGALFFNEAADSLAKLTAPYGCYFVTGNHDAKSTYNIDTLLARAHITKLSDEAVCIAGVNIVGRAFGSEKTLAQILAEKNVSKASPVVVMQHVPKKLAEDAQDGADLILSGHTHGYHYPFGMLLATLSVDNVYGVKYFGDTAAITSSGASAWGMRYKFPSNDEVVMVALTFKPV